MKFIKDSEKNIALHTCVLGTGEIYFNSKGVYTVSMNKNAIKQFTKISNYVSSEIKSYTMPLKQLQKVIELLHKSDLVYSVKFNDDGVLIINQGTWNISLNSKICDSNYESCFLEKQTVFTMDYIQAKAFKKSHCMGSDSSQVAFMGMYLDFNNNKIVTTDGKALDVLNIKFLLQLENCILDKEFILKAISKMKKDDIIEIKYSNNEYFINDNNIEVIEGKYPNYNDVMPKIKTNVIKIKDHKEFSKKIDAIKKHTDKESGRITLEVKENLLYFSVATVHGEACEVLEIENISNTDISSSCNYKGLQMLVNENNTEIVINGEGSPLLFIKENSKSLLMPMKRNEGIKTVNLIESNIVEIKEVSKIEQKTKSIPKETTMSTKSKTQKETTMSTRLKTQPRGATQQEALLYIHKEFNQTLESMQELINTVSQYNHESRLEFLETDLEKTVFKGLKQEVYTLLSDFTEFEYLDSLYTEIEPTTQAEVVERALKDVPITDIEPITQSKTDETTTKIDNNIQHEPRFIIKLFTDRQKSKVLSPEVFKIDTIEGDCIISNGYKYNVYNIGKVRISKKGRGSASINLTLDHKPTMNELQDLANQFISKVTEP